VALVVFLRGINVGGHRRLRPARLAAQLKHLAAVSIGAAGTFVIREPVHPGKLRGEFGRRLPFNVEIAICRGRDVVRLLSRDIFSDYPVQPDVVRFVSILTQRPRSTPSMPMSFPPSGRWLLKILGRENRFVFGLYRRHMKVIGFLGRLDRVFGVPVITRNWNTIAAIARSLERGTNGSS
jgi:hypothetical protein